MTKSPYQLGGSLPAQHPTYVTRQADQELYQTIQSGEFCYVFNSRQMGKSSLRVRTMERLQIEGFACAEIDLSSMVEEGITLESWYYGIIYNLADSFELTEFDLFDWWSENTLLSSNQKLDRFIKEILLPSTTQKLVIFIDEIDSILGLTFSLDGFFALIRSLYNKRSNYPDYQRLTFCFLGVATPSDLIQDKRRTPFNMGKAINLKGFHLEEVSPLITGLTGKYNAPQTVMKDILSWTGGQPFLTQKVCQLMVESSAQEYPDSVAELVREKVIKNWVTQDEPVHLRTIQDRIFRQENLTAQLLGMYQQIRRNDGVFIDSSREQIELQLSGLVVKKDGKLRIYNFIYWEVFNSEWIEQELEKLRPYASSLKSWFDSDCQDESRLLNGRALTEALEWSEGKNLTIEDNQFLNASQEFRSRELQRNLLVKEEESRVLNKANETLTLAEKKAKTELTIARKRARGIIGIGSGILAISLISAGIVWLQVKQARLELKKRTILLSSINSQNNYRTNNKLEALLEALNAGKKLQELEKSNSVSNDIKIQVYTALHQAVYGIRERNRLEGHFDDISNISFSPNGQLIASASRDGIVKLWHRNGKLLKSWQAHSEWIWKVKFSPDGQLLASSSDDEKVKLWSLEKLLNLEEESPLQILEHDSGITGISFSSNGQTLATASGYPGGNNAVKLWSVNSGKLIEVFPNHQKKVWDVSFSPDGKLIVSASIDETVKLWTVEGKLIKTIKAHTDGVISISFSPDGKFFLSASQDGTVKLWSRDGKLVKAFDNYGDWVEEATFSPDGQSFATVSGQEIKLWSRNGQNWYLSETLADHTNTARSANFSPDGKTLISGSSDNTIRLWSLHSKIPRITANHQKTLKSMSMTPDEQIIATASNDATIKFWNKEGNLLKNVEAHNNWIFDISFSPDGQTIASASKDKTVKLWSRDGELLSPPLVHNSAIVSLSFSPDGETIATAIADETINLWSRHGKLLRTFQGHSGEVWGVSFSPDGKTIASGSWDNTVKLWNLDGKLLHTLTSHNSIVWKVRFSPDGKTIASASGDKTVKLWSRDGKLLRTLTGHPIEVMDVRFSPNGEILASACDDGTIHIWNYQGNLLGSFQAHQAGVRKVLFSQDGQTLISAAANNTIHFWSLSDLALEGLMESGCNWLEDYLTHNSKVSQEERRLCQEKLAF